MLYIEIHQGEEAIKKLGFQQDIGGTVVCMKILTRVKKVWGQLSPNDTYFSDIWFSRVKTAKEAIAEGVDCWGPVKMVHKGFALATFKKLMN